MQGSWLRQLIITPIPLASMAPEMPTQPHLQDEVLQQSLQNPEEFWARQAEQLHWHKKPESTLRMAQKTLQSGVVHPTWDWFSGGEISTCYNCVDRHVAKGNGDVVAIYYDSPVTNTKETYTYNQLLGEVETLAGALREEGVGKGDVVMLYSKYMFFEFTVEQQRRMYI